MSVDQRPEAHASNPPSRQPGELNARELGRWAWRQLTSMRTALILLLLLALAAIPGSLIPQQGVDSLKTSNWQDAHPHLTKIYDKLDLFHVYSSPWFAAVYILLMVSLVGCIVPRLFVYARAMRAQPPAVPANLTRLPDSATYLTDEDPDAVEERARRILRRQRYRLRRGNDAGVSSEKGYLREAGNLLFHLSVILVLIGFASGALFGFKGGVIVVVGKDYGFTNALNQYDDFDPGSLFKASSLEPFTLHVDDFNVDWLHSGPRAGMATGFQSKVTYCQACDGQHDKTYDLRVNHPLSIGNTDVFLIGHGYAPVITVRDAKGDVIASGPTVFLPTNSTFFSFGAVKTNVPQGTPQVGLQGVFYPYEVDLGGQPTNLQGDIGDGSHAMLSFQAYTGDLDPNGAPQSVYTLDTSKAKMVTNTGGRAFNLGLHQTATLPNGLGTVTFDDVVRWNRLQLSHQPGRQLALGGVCLALLGLLGSLFIRPRRVWVRARRTPDGTLVEVAALDRSGNGDTAAVVTELVAQLQEKP